MFAQRGHLHLNVVEHVGRNVIPRLRATLAAQTHVVADGLSVRHAV